MYQSFRLHQNFKYSHVGLLKGFCPGLIFTASVCVLNTKLYCIINLGNRSSQATCMGFSINLYSAGWFCAAFGAQIQIRDIFSKLTQKNKVKITVMLLKYEYVTRHCQRCCVLYSPLLKSGQPWDLRSSTYQGSVTTCSLKCVKFITAQLGFPLIFLKISQGRTVWATGKP